MSAPLVLLPGMNCSPRLWTPALDSARGELGSADPIHPRLRRPTLDGCVDDLLAQLPPRFALAGLSLGAIVALALVRRAPERVERLALLAVNPRPPVPVQREAWAAQRTALADGRTARDLQRDLLPVLLSARSLDTPLERETLTMADETGDADLDAQLSLQATRVDERPALERLSVPTTVVAGEQDALVGLDRHEEVHRAVTGSRLVVLPGVGHLSPLEAPGAVGDALALWWAEPMAS
ncbi:alpha/beta fold hydrolase [Aeromicrobium sp. CF4.19]|uniref:alpha/beta fold hydrolase n=1 Tax=Aeromicrobium sp. CF4.19 TaxID=3373082 RepID=UPI003EE566E9